MNDSAPMQGCQDSEPFVLPPPKGGAILCNSYCSAFQLPLLEPPALHSVLQLGDRPLSVGQRSPEPSSKR